MKIRSTALALAVGFIAAGAVMDPAIAGHWYIAGQAGAAFLRDSSATEQLGAISMHIGTLNYDTGWGLGGSAGYGFSNGFRVEGEVTYRDNNIGGISGNPFKTTFSGDSSSWAFMANGYYDFSTGGRWTPYVGGGIGLALDHQTLDAVMPGNVVDDTSTEFAYQGIAGIGYQITESLNLALEYRYFGTTSPAYALHFHGAPPGIEAKSDYGSNNIMLKLRWNVN